MSRELWTSVGRTAALVVVLIAAAGVFASLGRWQLDRAEQVRAVAAEYRAAGAAEPLSDFAAAAAAHEGLRFRKLRIDGSYEDGVHILLDNITHDGAAGYHVLTPFRPAGAERRVLVNRGWIAAGPDRGAVPALDAAARAQRISGRIDRMPSAALALDAPVETLREGVFRLSFPSIPEVERLLGLELAPFQLLLDAGEPGGFERRWSPATARADRNTAYAGQWFIMAAAAAVVAVWAAVRAYLAARGSRP